MKQKQFYTIESLLAENRQIYQIPDDRLYSVDDLVYNHQKFISQYQEGLKNKPADELDLDVSVAWFLALINRFHIDLEKLAWQRYSYKCPFCLEIPCICSGDKLKSQKTGRPASQKPKTLDQWQEMVDKIYPNETPEILNNFYQNLNQLNYLLRHFLRERKKTHFYAIEKVCADHFVLILRIYNSIPANLSHNFRKMFKNGCYVCHKVPCECNYYQ